VNIVAWFWISFAATLLMAALSLWSGFRRRRKFHLVTGPVTMVLLTITILLTEKLAQARVFPEVEMAIHLVFAKVAAALALPVIATGIATAVRPERGRFSWRRIHRWAVVAFFIAVVIATGTGIWVFSLSRPA